MLAVGIGSAILVFLGMYFFVALIFWWLAVVVDGLPVLKALERGVRLVRGHRWHVARYSDRDQGHYIARGATSANRTDTLETCTDAGVLWTGV